MFAEYAPWLIGGVLVGAAVFFGIRYFQSYTNERAFKAGAQFSAMTTALNVNDQAKSRADRRWADQGVSDFRPTRIRRS